MKWLQGETDRRTNENTVSRRYNVRQRSAPMAVTLLPDGRFLVAGGRELVG
jgi:hypothetical protein